MPHTLRLMPYTLYLNILDKVGHAIIEIVMLLAYVLWLMAYCLWLMAYGSWLMVYAFALYLIKNLRGSPTFK